MPGSEHDRAEFCEDVDQGWQAEQLFAFISFGAQHVEKIKMINLLGSWVILIKLTKLNDLKHIVK